MDEKGKMLRNEIIKLFVNGKINGEEFSTLIDMVVDARVESYNDGYERAREER